MTVTARGVLLGWLLAVVLAAPATARVTQPTQPTSGPGGSHHRHAGIRVSSGGSGADAWFAFEPTDPKPRSAPLAVITHGYGEYTGYAMQRALIEHTVRRGAVVIYPRWQTGIASPCPGPFDIEPCMLAEVAGITGALRHLSASGHRVRPDTTRTSYFGFSFGGIITANLANRWRSLGVPKPRAVFLDDPHDGGLTGAFEPALDDDLRGIPATTRVVCHSGAHGVFDDRYSGTGDPEQVGRPKRDGSCNAVFPKLTSVPAANKALVLTSDDAHGTPALSSDHGVCSGGTATGFGGPVDAYDWGFCWKTWDALRSCATAGTLCRYALGNTPQQRHIGTWSDGTPIVGLRVRRAAPIRADPTPPRAKAPARRRR